ncbi:MAG: M15 family metallopeptidase, partial [Desulfovibrionaceae bacterium]|nr:M15 family metallopeptidase [Desulfovibrionaceae bacterium]
VDLNPELAPDRQGSPLAWHPLQQAYPPAIVTALEEQGFIWGGKWQRYDLAHFEYRPELIYKARILRALEEIRDSF